MREKVQVVVIVKELQIYEVLLLKTNNERGGEWQNMTGAVERGESLIQAACRELFEETGIEDSSLVDLQYSFQFIDRWGKNANEHCFLCLLQTRPSIKLSCEHQDFRWESSGKIEQNSYGNISHFKVFNLAEKKI